MGYLTDYTMIPNKYNPESLSEGEYLAIEVFIKSTKDEGWSYLDDVWRGEGYGFTWYDHDAEMGKLSIAFPDILFTLWGYGQEADDLWKKYYLNGKSQLARAIITYPNCELASMCPFCYGAGILHADGYPSIGCSRCDGSGEVIDG